MKIVIDMPKDIYAEVCAEVEREIHPNQDYRWVMVLRSICNGTPLPRGHGDLKDTNAICTDIISALGIKDESFLLPSEKAIYKRIEEAPTIIEADKEGTDE